MPTTYAHYRFGNDVFSYLPERLQNEIRPYRNLFDIGLHGPDILFYDNPFQKNEINELGRLIHKQPGAVFFEHALKLYKSSSCKKRLRAYLYGFICHFTLDSICHPYIQKMIDTSGIKHNKLEAEFDTYLMRKDGLDPVLTLPTRHLHATKNNALVISQAYDNLSPTDIRRTLLWMKLMLRLIHAPRGAKRAIILSALKLSGFYESYGGLITNPTADPDCQYYCVLLDRLYEEAVTDAVENIKAYQSTLKSGTPLRVTFQNTFGRGKNWKSLSLK